MDKGGNWRRWGKKNLVAREAVSGAEQEVGRGVSSCRNFNGGGHQKGVRIQIILRNEVGGPRSSVARSITAIILRGEKKKKPRRGGVLKL